MPNALSLFPNGRGDEDERLPLSGKDDPLPAWLLEEWPGPAAYAKVERLAHPKAAAPLNSRGATAFRPRFRR